MSDFSRQLMAALLWPVYDVPALFRPGPFDMVKIAVIAELGVALAAPVFGMPLGRGTFDEIGDFAFGYLAAAAISFAMRMM